MKSVYIHGSYFGNNYGDVLLVDLFAKKVRDAGFLPIFPFASSFYQEQTGVATGLVDPSTVLCGVYCGGGYFGEPSKAKLKWSFRNTLRHLRSYNLFRKNDIPYGVFGAGFGPITFQPYKGVALNIFTGASEVIVRDPESKSFITDYLKSQKAVEVDVNADVVISLSKKDIPANNFESAKNKFQILPDGKRYVGVHITDKFKDKAAFPSILNAVRELSNLDHNLHFIIISDGTSRLGRKLQQEIDGERIQKTLGNDRSSFYNYENHWEMTAYLSLLDVVITSKLHVGVVSTAMETSVISIPYHSKTIRYYQQVKAEDRCLNSFESSGDVLKHLESYIYSDPIIVPESVISSSGDVFSRMVEFISNCEKTKGV